MEDGREVVLVNYLLTQRIDRSLRYVSKRCSGVRLGQVLVYRIVKEEEIQDVIHRRLILNRGSEPGVFAARRQN